MARFWKLQALGNDLLFLDHDDRVDWPAAARQWCDRRLGAGADGLLTIASEGGRLKVRMWNADGTSDFCGNGLACAAQLSVMRGGPLPPRLFTNEREILCQMEPKGAPDTVAVNLGEPLFEAKQVPTSFQDGLRELCASTLWVAGRTFSILSISTGSPHAVIFVDDLPGDETFLHYSPLIERHPAFPERTSVLWVKPAAGGLAIRIWERGVGETLGCGTGVSAAAVAAILTGRLTSPVTVRSRGGVGMIDYLPREGVWLRVRPALVSVGEIALPGRKSPPEHDLRSPC